MRQDAATIPNIKVVVIVFTGNLLTPCAQGRGDQTAVYTADGNIAAAFWQSHGVHVAWVAPPGAVETTDPQPMASVYQGVAAAYGQGYVDGGANFRDPTTGVWAVTLPCLSFDVSAEPAPGACGSDGTVQVRFSSSNGHICDVDSGLAPCPVYSSGVVRWGSAVASAALSSYAEH
jgi:hypothetical protein